MQSSVYFPVFGRTNSSHNNNLALISLVWRKPLVNETEEISEEERIEENVEEYVAILRRIPGCDDYDNSDVMEWLQCDKDNNSDGDIIDT